VNVQHAQHPPTVATPLTRAASRYLYRGLALFVLAANILLGAYALAVIVPSVIQVESGGWAPVPILPSPSPTEATSLMAPMGVMMPNDADCSACHTAPGATKPAPAMAHPLEGWQNCTECHATDRLVETAPGHSSLHKEDCLLCHAPAADQSPAPRPHHTYNGTACTACHGNPAIPQAPLPQDMSERGNCWVCHGLTDGDELWNSTAAPVPGTSATAAPTAGPDDAAGPAVRYELEPTR
jgi:hypothetical protein